MVALRSDCFMKVTSCTAQMATKEGMEVEALYKRLSRTEPENGLTKECQDFHERMVRASELANWQGEVPELQMSIRTS